MNDDTGMEALNRCQRAFVMAYMTNGFNASEAALAAGYSNKHPRKSGFQVLWSDRVRDAIEAIFVRQGNSRMHDFDRRPKGGSPRP